MQGNSTIQVQYYRYFDSDDDDDDDLNYYVLMMMLDYLKRMLKIYRMMTIDKIINQKNQQIQLNMRIKSRIVP